MRKSALMRSTKSIKAMSSISHSRLTCAIPAGRRGYHTACADLIREDHVGHIVGCYTSASRKQVIPIVERTERLLLASGTLRRVRSSDNVIYVGARPTSTSYRWCAICWITFSTDVFCIGSNYVWTWNEPRHREIVTSAGAVSLPNVCWNLERPPWTTSSRRSSTEGRRLCSIRWSENLATLFMRALHAAAAHAASPIPMLSCSLCEPELKLTDRQPPSMHHVVAYFESIEG